LQTVNVLLGGSFHPDLQRISFSSHAAAGKREQRRKISIQQGSILGKIAGDKRGSVYSGMSGSIDGVVEALERDEKENKSFLLPVQWHPERMKDSINPLAEGVARTILEEARIHGNQKHHQINHQNQNKRYNSY
jgi:putative glutamine amidotransferase